MRRSLHVATTEIEPIRADDDHHAALLEIERVSGTEPGTRQGDRLDILVTLVHAYEEQHFPLDPPDPVEAIKFRMEQQGLTRKELEGLLGARASSRWAISTGLPTHLARRSRSARVVACRPCRRR